MHPKARQQRLEMFMGILGVFTVIAFVLAVSAELHGEAAIKEVFVLLLFGVPLVLVFRAWQHYDGWGGG